MHLGYRLAHLATNIEDCRGLMPISGHIDAGVATCTLKFSAPMILCRMLLIVLLN